VRKIFIKTRVVGLSLKALLAPTINTLSQKRANFDKLYCCSFDKHGLIVIIVGQQHQHTSRNDMHIQLSLSIQFYTYFICFDIAAMEMYDN